MDLLEQIELNRPTLDDVDNSRVHPTNISDYLDVQGRIAEQFVRQWLGDSGFNFCGNFEDHNKNYLINFLANGVVVSVNSRNVCEFDFVGTYLDKPYVVEVKSSHLNGFTKKANLVYSVAEELFGTDVNLLLFSPHSLNKNKQLKLLSERNHSIKCINMGYKLKQLHKAIDRFYFQQPYFKIEKKAI